MVRETYIWVVLGSHYLLVLTLCNFKYYNPHIHNTISEPCKHLEINLHSYSILKNSWTYIDANNKFNTITLKYSNMSIGLNIQNTVHKQFYEIVDEINPPIFDLNTIYQPLCPYKCDQENWIPSLFLKTRRSTGAINWLEEQNIQRRVSKSCLLWVWFPISLL